MRSCRALCLAAAALLAGCATITTADGTRLRFGSDEFRVYVERVFREQNKTGSDVAFALDDATSAGGTEPRELAVAEEGLLAACAGLNELATSRRDAQHLGLHRSAAAARGAPDCERATRAAESALATRAR
jgi:hypothetical protein